MPSSPNHSKNEIKIYLPGHPCLSRVCGPIAVAEDVAAIRSIGLPLQCQSRNLFKNQAISLGYVHGVRAILTGFWSPPVTQPRQFCGVWGCVKAHRSVKWSEPQNRKTPVLTYKRILCRSCFVDIHALAGGADTPAAGLRDYRGYSVRAARRNL